VQTAQPLFEAKNIIKRYGNATALSGIDIRLNRGEFMTIFGANGAGKTTFLKIAASLLQPTDGTVLIRGKKLDRSDSQSRSDLGYIAHETFLYPNLTARENLRFYASLYSVENHSPRIDEMLDAVGLLHRADDVVRSFSRGMLQRLTIARAFLHNPSLLLFDEPYTGLDTHASGILNELLQSMSAGDRAGIMTTHNIEQGFDIATHVAILHRGKIQYVLPTKETTKQDFKRTYIELMQQDEKR